MRDGVLEHYSELTKINSTVTTSLSPRHPWDAAVCGFGITEGQLWKCVMLPVSQFSPKHL